MTQDEPSNDETSVSALVTRPLWQRWLHLHALAVLGITQPVYSQLGRNPTFLVSYGLPTAKLWLLVLGIFVVPGMFVFAVGYLTSRLLRHERLVWSLAIGLLSAVIFLPLLNSMLTNRSVASLPASLLVGVGAGYFYDRRPAAATYLSHLSLVTPALLALLIFRSGVGALLFADEVVEIGAGGNETSVVLIVLDELPLASFLTLEGELDPARAPNMVRFAQSEATWYSNTTTVSEWTKWAVPSILTGTRPNDSSFPAGANHKQNLFTLTAPSHDLLVSELLTTLCPSSICVDDWSTRVDFQQVGLIYGIRVRYLRWLLPKDLERFSNASFSNVVGLFSAPSTEELEQSYRHRRHGLRFEEFTGKAGSVDTPAVMYLHSLVSHAPWTLLPDGTVYNGSVVPGVNAVVSEEQAWVDQGIHRHLLQLQYADRLVGELLAELRANGTFEDTMIIITSDHGATFAPGAERRQASIDTLSEIALVPLFIKYPRQDHGDTAEVLVENIDILPTIAAVLAVDLPEDVDGRSLLGESIDDSRKREVFAKPNPTFSAFESDLDLMDAVERMVAVVPSGTQASQIWSPLHLQSFIGHRIDTGGVKNEAVFMVRFDEPDRFDGIDRSAGYLPIRVTASIRSGSAPTGTPILVSVNGSIAGAAEVVGSKVSILIDPATILDGSNEIIFYTVQDGELAWVRSG